jgi:hypothetical protein
VFKNIALGAFFLFLFYGGYRTVKNEMLELRHFTRGEFGIWWPLMSQDLLLKLDAFREKWGAPVVITSHPDGLGREDESGSMHNVLKWGEVRAVDVFPKGMDSLADRQRAFQIAKSVGLTGIGLYTDTMPSNMLHLDNREEFLYWTRVSGKYNYNRIM